MTSRISAPPKSDSACNVEFPQSLTCTLTNGLSLIVLPDKRLPQVSVRLGLRKGRIHEPQENTALLSVSSEMLPLGAGGQSAQQIAETLDYYAIQFENSVGLESSYLAWEALTPNLEASFEVMSTLVLKPDFPEDELDRLKARWKSSLMQLRSQPSFLAGERSRLTLYPEHPLSRFSIPPEDLERTSASDLLGSHLAGFAPTSSLLLCCGDIDLKQAASLVEEYFGSWVTPEKLIRPFPEIPPFQPGRIDLVHRPGSVQARVVVSGKAPCRSSLDLTPVNLANQIFGGSASSRLFLNLREEKGLTYGAYSRLVPFNQDGIFQASADVRADSVAVAIEETIAEIIGISSRPPRKDEISRAQSEIIGSFVRQMETSAGVGSMELNRRLYNLPEDYYTHYISDLLAVDRRAMLDLSAQYLNGDCVSVTVVGDAEMVRSDLAGLGTLYVWDASGQMLEKPA